MRISDWSSDVCSSDLMTATTRLALPYLVPGQAQKETTHNEALIRLDLAVKASALSIGLNISPQTPEPGQCWIVGTSPTGILGREGEIGRASCRERVCQYVSISVVAVSLKKQNT